jgi:outer membrane protein assembly factor BamB
MSLKKQKTACLTLVFLVLTCWAEGGEWSRFRGPNGSGVADTEGLPVEFGPDHNVIWKTPLPLGHSSPIVYGDRIFLTAVEGESLLTLCLDRRTGEILWRTESPRARREKLDERNNPASPSPTTDGENVYVFFPDYGMLSYDFEGKERWRLPLGPFDNVYGMGASPIVAEGKVVLVCDQGTGSFLIAVAKDDGRVLWKVDRPEAKSGHSTPILYHPASEPTQLLVPGSFLLTAYSLDTGEKIWWVSGLSFEMKSTPVMSEDTVFVNGYGSQLNDPGKQIRVPSYEEARSQDADGDGRFTKEELTDQQAQRWMVFTDLDGDGFLDESEWNFYQAAMASTDGMLGIELGGRGDTSDTSVRWKYHRAVPQLPSPILYKDILYMINDRGILTSFVPETGEVLAQGRIKEAVDNYFASPVAADDKIYWVSESGKVSVMKPDGSLDVLAVNDLGDLCYATPAIVDGRIYLRTAGTLYCFGKPPPTGSASGN